MENQINSVWFKRIFSSLEYEYFILLNEFLKSEIFSSTSEIFLCEAHILLTVLSLKTKHSNIKYQLEHESVLVTK